MAKPAVRGLAQRVERGVRRLMPRGDGPPLLDPYRGFATADHLVVRGRVLTALRRTTPEPDQSRWTNLRQMAGLFLTDEVAGVPVRVPDRAVAGTSDEEGYLWLEVPRRDATPGWHEVAVEIEGLPGSRRGFPVLVPDPGAAFGVISDVDDTLIETGAYSLVRNLWTTFTGSALTRKVYPDAVRLLAGLSGAGRNPVFYVSSSPWNLHHFLDRVLGAAGLPPGPMFLRDFGLGAGEGLEKSGRGGHREHKGAAIDRVMEANPELGFVLVGDTGQKDALVYRDAALRHPGRVSAVVLREPGPGPSPAARAAMAAIRAAGVELHHGVDYSGAIARFRGAAPSNLCAESG